MPPRNAAGSLKNTHLTQKTIMTTSNKKLAVLIDADNAPADCIDAMLEEIAKYGTATVKRIYGDWSHGLSKWKAALLPHAIIPVQQFAYTKGKNATDMALVIDAMDLLYSGNFDGFCLVSSDSDFTRLASRIRESGLAVYGFGEKKTPESFRKACDKFTYIEVFRPQKQNSEKNKNPRKNSTPPTLPENVPAPETDLTQLIKRAVKENADDLGWANLGPIGSYISKVSPDFDSRLYGYGKLSDLIKSLDLFEHRTDNNQLQIRRRKNDGSHTAKQPEKTVQTIHAGEPAAESAPKKRGRKPKAAAENPPATTPAQQPETAAAEAATPPKPNKRGRKPKTVATAPIEAAADTAAAGKKPAKLSYSRIIPAVQQAVDTVADSEGWAGLGNVVKQLEILLPQDFTAQTDLRELVRGIYADWLEIKKAGRGERVRINKRYTH